MIVGGMDLMVYTFNYMEVTVGEVDGLGVDSGCYWRC